MAVGFKSSRFKLLGDVQIWPEAGIMALNLFDLKEQMAFVLVNVHADWGRAGLYRNDFESAFKPVGPLVIGGDFNLDDFIKPGENQNKDIFDCLMETCQLNEFSSGLDFTAKSVHNASFPVKLDMVMGRRFIPLETFRIPSRFVHLVPHTRDEQFRLDDENNHFSDHAALVVALEYES